MQLVTDGQTRPIHHAFTSCRLTSSTERGKLLLVRHFRAVARVSHRIGEAWSSRRSFTVKDWNAHEIRLRLASLAAPRYWKVFRLQKCNYIFRILCQFGQRIPFQVSLFQPHIHQFITHLSKDLPIHISHMYIYIYIYSRLWDFFNKPTERTLCGRKVIFYSTFTKNDFPRTSWEKKILFLSKFTPERFYTIAVLKADATRYRNTDISTITCKISWLEL